MQKGVSMLRLAIQNGFDKVPLLKKAHLSYYYSTLVCSGNLLDSHRLMANLQYK